MISPRSDGLGCGGADVGDDDLQERHRRGQKLVDRAGEFREVNAERSVGDALGEQREHDQPRHDERAIGDAVDLGHARADGGAENDEIKRSGDHRRDHALKQRAQRPRHLEFVNRPDAMPVECQVAHGYSSIETEPEIGHKEHKVHKDQEVGILPFDQRRATSLILRKLRYLRPISNSESSPSTI